MSTASQRSNAVKRTVGEIRAIEREQGVTPASLEAIKSALLRLAAHTELFSQSDFPPPAPGGAKNHCLYRLSQDDDNRFALYVNSSLGGGETPAHNHTTWAVIVGVLGCEHNRFYRRTEEGGVRQTGSHDVVAGTGVAFLPDDLHSIHMAEGEPVLNFHMYGLALECLDKREYYVPGEHIWKIFPPHSDIREARS